MVWASGSTGPVSRVTYHGWQHPLFSEDFCQHGLTVTVLDYFRGWYRSKPMKVTARHAGCLQREHAYGCVRRPVRAVVVSTGCETPAFRKWRVVFS